MKIPPSPHGQDKTAENKPLQNTDSEIDLSFHKSVQQVMEEMRPLFEAERAAERDVVRWIDKADELRKLGMVMPWDEQPAEEQDDEPTETVDRYKRFFPEIEWRIINIPLHLIRPPL